MQFFVDAEKGMCYYPVPGKRPDKPWRNYFDSQNPDSVKCAEAFTLAGVRVGPAYRPTRSHPDYVGILCVQGKLTGAVVPIEMASPEELRGALFALAVNEAQAYREKKENT